MLQALISVLIVVIYIMFEYFQTLKELKMKIVSGDYSEKISFIFNLISENFLDVGFVFLLLVVTFLIMHFINEVIIVAPIIFIMVGVSLMEIKMKVISNNFSEKKDKIFNLISKICLNEGFFYFLIANIIILLLTPFIKEVIIVAPIAMLVTGTFISTTLIIKS